jgi:AcrR family transcriptional regulator
MRPKKISDEDILQTVRRCLIEQGGSVSTQFIADQVGVSQATLFKRFGSKSNLLQTAILLPSKASKARNMMQLLSQGPTEAPVRTQMEQLCLRLLNFFDDVLPSFASLHASGLTFDEPLPDDTPPILARKYLTNWIAQLQEQGRIRKEVHPESIALTLIGAMQHRPLRIHLLRDTTLTQTDEEYVSSMVEVLWQGLSPVKRLIEQKEKP